MNAAKNQPESDTWLKRIARGLTVDRELRSNAELAAAQERVEIAMRRYENARAAMLVDGDPAERRAAWREYTLAKNALSRAALSRHKIQRKLMKPGEALVLLGVRVPASLRDAVKVAAADRGISAAALVEAAIRRELSEGAQTTGK